MGRSTLAWRGLAVFVAVVLVWIFIYHGLGVFFGEAYSDRVGHAVRAVLTSALIVPLIFLARRYLDQRPWAGLRLTSLRDGWIWLCVGMVCWVVPAGIGLVITLALGWARVSFAAPDSRTLLLALYLPILVFLFEALPEELVFRGYFYRNLADRYRRWIAVIGQALLFIVWGVVIGAAGSVDRIVLFFTFSLVLGVLRVLTGNLWTPIGFHLAFQVITQFNSAAIRDDVIQIQGRADLELVVFWFFPIVLGGIALMIASIIRGRAGWSGRDPDLPVGAFARS